MWIIKCFIFVLLLFQKLIFKCNDLLLKNGVACTHHLSNVTSNPSSQAPCTSISVQCLCAVVGGRLYVCSGWWRSPGWRWRCSWCPSPRCPSRTCTAARSVSGPSTLTCRNLTLCVLINKKLFATFAPINWLPFYLFRKLSKKLLLW